MKNMTILRAVESCCCAELINCENPDAELGRVVIDSRQITEGDLFVAYKGEHVDGHDYVVKAMELGAACSLVEHAVEGGGAQIVVPDVQEALEAIAAEYRNSLNIPIVGITGSVGKTSAKEMISAVLAEKLNVHKTEGNLNNQIGVPMTLSRISDEHEVAVVEMGISDFGEMSRLSQMARPQIAVFTVIGHAHLEFLHDLDGVFEAKTEMLDFMDDDAVVIYNGDDSQLRRLNCRQRKISFGISEVCDVRAENVEVAAGNTSCTIVYGDRRLDVSIPAFGQHMVYAALEGAAVGFVMGLSDEEIIRGIGNYETVGRRAAVVDTGWLTLIDDCYNANPDSIKSGIDSMLGMNGRKVCILGDMLELGENEAEMHCDVGAYAAQKGIDLVIASGPLSAEISRGAGDRGLYFESKEELISALAGLLQKGDSVLVKASRSMHFEEISEAIKAMGNGA